MLVGDRLLARRKRLGPRRRYSRGAGRNCVCLSSFGLTRVYAIPCARNMASRRVLEKAGFQQEGLMRRAAIKDGEVLDQLLYARTDLDIGKPDGGDR